MSGPGPDTYPLPDLNPDDTYRICVGFIDRQGTWNGNGIGCSTPFNSS